MSAIVWKGFRPHMVDSARPRAGSIVVQSLAQAQWELGDCEVHGRGGEVGGGLMGETGPGNSVA